MRKDLVNTCINTFLEGGFFLCNLLPQVVSKISRNDHEKEYLDKFSIFFFPSFAKKGSGKYP